MTSMMIAMVGWGDGTTPAAQAYTDAQTVREKSICIS